MFMKVPSSLLLIIILVFLSSCAKRGTPDGGPLDENPPEIVREIPKNNSIYFNDEKIRIFFDEYIKLEKLNSQLVVSPPIDKSKYSIFPPANPTPDRRKWLPEQHPTLRCRSAPEYQPWATFGGPQARRPADG